MPEKSAVASSWSALWVAPLLVALIGFAATGGALQRMHADATADRQQQFERLAEHLTDEVRLRLQIPMDGLRGLRATFASLPKVDNDLFRRWVQARRHAGDLPGVSHFGYAELVNSTEPAALVRARRDAGVSAPALAGTTPPVARPPLHVLRVAEPATSAWPGPGDDLGARDGMADTLQAALMRDDATLSGRISLGPALGNGLLLLMPVFHLQPVADTPAARRDALAGLVLVAVDVREMLGSLASAGDLAFDLYDGDSGAASHALHRGGEGRAARHQALFRIELGGRSLALRAFSRPAFDAGADLAPLLAVGAAGVALSLLTAFSGWLLLAGRVRAEALAERMTVELDRQASIVRRTSNAVIATDAQLRITWVNEGFTRMYGYSAAEAIGRLPGALLGSGNTPAAAIAAIERGAREGVAISEHVLNRTRDGEERWVHIDIQPLHDRQGRLQGFVEIGTDLTAAKTASDDLAAERERLAGIIEGTQVGTWEWNIGTGLIKRDERAAALVGCSVEELASNRMDNWRERCHPADLERMRSRMQEHLTGETDAYSCDYRIRHQDGRWVWVQAGGRISKRGADGQPLGLSGTLMDINQRKLAEQALQDSEAMLVRTGRIAGVGGWQFDVASDTVRWTAEAHLVLDLPPGRALGMNDAFDYCASAARPRLQQAFQAALDSGLGWDMELPFISPKRGATWMRSLGEAEREAGQTVRVFGTLQDITERKALELRLAEGERFAREITDNLPVRVAYFDVAGCYRFVNQRVCERFGLPREQIIGRTLTELTRTKLDATRLAAIVRVRGGETAQWEGPETLHGQTLTTLSTLIPSFDAEGKVIGAYSTVVDVTELRRSEHEMRRTYEMLQSIVESMPCAISVFDSELTLVLHNSQFRSLLDFPDSLFAGPRTSFESIIRFNALRGEYGSADIETVVANTVERGRHPTHHQFERTRPNGSVLEVRGAPLPGGGFVTTYVDISERKRMELEQQGAAATLRAMLDALPCGLTMHDADGTVVIHNARWLDLYGYDAKFIADTGLKLEAMVRRTTRRGDYGQLDEEAALEAAWARVAEARRGPHFWLRPTHDGRMLEIRSEPVPGGAFVSTYIDVTEHKRAEAEREKARAILLGAIDAVDEAFVLFDPDDRLVLCNERYRTRYAASSDLVVPGARFEDIVRGVARRGQHKEAIGRVDEWVAERVALHRSGKVMQVQQLADGTWLRVIERTMDDGHIVGFRIDITDLMTARQAAEQASQSKSQFLANMSHEIRTPMNAILGMLSLLQRTEQTPRQVEYTRKTEGAAKSLLSLLNDILDFSKAEAGKMTLDAQPFAIEQMLDDLSVILAASAGARPVELLFDIDPALPRQLVGDEPRLRQVLINLAGNALKFTERGEVVLALRLVQRRGSDVEIELSVSDTGIGIAPENQAHIFNAFTQAEASTTRRFGGTGLGLAICQRLIALMGSEMHLSSELGRGSRFHFRLSLPAPPTPATPATPAAPAALAAFADAGPPAQALRCLITDDHPRALRVLADLARTLGWTVDTAPSREQALEMAAAAQARSEPYQVVFIDWGMPGPGGAEFAQRLRTAGSDGAASTPVIVVMGNAHAREQMSRLGQDERALADGFVAKPLTASMLHDAVAEALAGRQPVVRRSSARHLSMRPLAGMRLLVVEDNPNNQQVAQELLEDEGARVTLANNGQEGVDAVAAAEPPFDAVLMDVQMPVMDGFTATALIRKQLGRAALPIIAMTANAMANDREACLAAGMTEHVGKPFDLERLIGVLLRQTGRQTRHQAAPKARAELAGAPEALQALAARHGINLRAALGRYMGKLEVYTRMLHNFERTLHQLPQELAASAAQGDIAAAVRAAHSLRGLAATLGVDRLAAAAGAAEKRLQAPDGLAHLAACAHAVADAAHAVAPGLAELTAGLLAITNSGAPGAESAAVAAAALPALDPGLLRSHLAQMSDLLSSSDMSALDSMTALREQFLAAAGGALHTALMALDAAVAELDFERAARLCDDALAALAAGLAPNAGTGVGQAA